MKLFVPGRICLFGEHSDWAGEYRRVNPEIQPGVTLIAGTNQGIYANVSAHPASLILNSVTSQGDAIGPYEIPMQSHALLQEARSGSFWSYIAGVAYQAALHHQVRGLVIDNYKTDLPIGKGLSSSAAICVLVARAFNRLYDLKLSVRGEMELAYQGEITTSSQCGRMDQGCAFGDRTVQMTFDGDHLDTQEILVGNELYYVIVDLGASKDTRRILSDLNRCYPFAEDEIARGVHDLLGSHNQRLVSEAVEALNRADASRLGRLMEESQALFDRLATPASPQELAAPRLHDLMRSEEIRKHVWGAKGMGSQGDGAAQFLARSQSDQRAVIEIVQDKYGMHALSLTLQASQRVRKAVIPAAGFGTRLFPATKATKKEFFPVIDREGVAKPAILLIVEEALEAGMEEVIIIVQESDREMFQSFFNLQITPANYSKLPDRLQDYAERLMQIGEHVRIIVQPTQDGFGHAVYCAAEVVGEEAFLLMLGDHLYHTREARSCARQLLDAYHQNGTSILGLHHTPEEQVTSFGTVAGAWIEPGRLLQITEFTEKPSVEYARQNLRVPGLGEDQYLTVFGQYVLGPELFDILAENIEHNMRERGEFQLTSALERMRREVGFLGLVVNGEAYDIGQPARYLNTLRTFSPGATSE